MSEKNKDEKNVKIKMRIKLDEDDPDIEKLLNASKITKEPIIYAGDRIDKVIIDNNGEKKILSPDSVLIGSACIYLDIVIGDEKFSKQSFDGELEDDKIILNSKKYFSNLPFYIEFIYLKGVKPSKISVGTKSNSVDDIYNFLIYQKKIYENDLKIFLSDGKSKLCEININEGPDENFLNLIENVKEIYQKLNINYDIPPVGEILNSDFITCKEILEILSTKKLVKKDNTIEILLKYNKDTKNEIEDTMTRLSEGKEFMLKDKGKYTLFRNKIDLGKYFICLSPFELVNEEEVYKEFNKNNMEEDIELKLIFKQKNSNEIVIDYSESNVLRDL